MISDLLPVLVLLLMLIVCSSEQKPFLGRLQRWSRTERCGRTLSSNRPWMCRAQFLRRTTWKRWGSSEGAIFEESTQNTRCRRSGPSRVGWGHASQPPQGRSQVAVCYKQHQSKQLPQRQTWIETYIHRFTWPYQHLFYKICVYRIEDSKRKLANFGSKQNEANGYTDIAQLNSDSVDQFTFACESVIMGLPIWSIFSFGHKHPIAR